MSQQLTLNVPGMTCGHCESAITRELATLPGVDQVEVDLASKVVTVSGRELDRDAVVGAIDEAGFDVA